MLCLAIPTKSSPFYTASTVWAFLPQMKKINLQKTNTQTPPMLSNPSGCSTDALPLLERKQRAKRQAGKPSDFQSHQQMLQSETQPVVLPPQKIQANAKSRQDALQSHEQSLSSTLPHFSPQEVLVGRKSHLALWCRCPGTQCGLLFGFWVFLFFFLSKIFYQAKHLTGFQLAQPGHRRDAGWAMPE